MIIVDRLLRERAAQGRPIRVGLIGAGFMARGITNQCANSVPGMVVAAIANRTVLKAQQAYAEAGVPGVRTSTPCPRSRTQFDRANRS